MKRLVSLALSMVLILSLAACASTAPQSSQSAPQESQTVSDESPMGDLSVTYDLSVGQMGTGIKAAMVVLAHEMGYYEEEGLNVELTQISNLNDGLTAITLGKLDVLPFGVIPTCTFIAQGADLTVIGGTIAEGSACVALPEREEEFRDIQNFAGKTVACVRAETGRTYKELLQKHRLELAARLLRRSDMTIQQIIAQVGYENTSYFYRLFRAHYGQSPREYRLSKLNRAPDGRK